jgi:hypothetical protein
VTPQGGQVRCPNGDLLLRLRATASLLASRVEPVDDPIGVRATAGLVAVAELVAGLAIALRPPAQVLEAFRAMCFAEARAVVAGQIVVEASGFEKLVLHLVEQADYVSYLRLGGLNREVVQVDHGLTPSGP